MAEADGSRETGRAPARGRVDEIRRALAATLDAPGRARLRIRLADVLSALGDTSAAVVELKQAAAEAPSSAGLLFTAGVVARRLKAEDGDALRLAVSGPRAAASAAGMKSRGQGGRARPLAKTQPRSADASRKSAVSGALLGSSPLAEPPQAVAPAPLPPTAGAPEPAHGKDPLDVAFEAVVGKKPVRARRLGEEQARLGQLSGTRRARLQDLVQALDQHGARRESLRLARTLVEGNGDGTGAAAQAQALSALVDRAIQAGETELVWRWSNDLGRPAVRDAVREAASRDALPLPGAARFRAAQKAALSARDPEASQAVLARLLPVLADQAAGGAALALAERLATAPGAALVPGRAELLRLAFEGARVPRRRAELAARWAGTLKDEGDVLGALSALDRAIDELPAKVSGSLRAARVDLLRATGREGKLSQALEADAEVATGAARTALRVQQANLLDRLGEFDTALEVRLSALKDVPGDLGLLGPARQRLEAVGRLDRSLELATAAVSQVADRAARAGLLRDCATLAEATGGDSQRAALAWLEVLALYPSDHAAGEAAERLLRQTGDRGRLGALLAWKAARQVEPDARAAVLWRLAEFRRLELQEPLSALTLYRQIVESRERSPDAPAFKDEDWQRRDDDLAVHTARALAAPTVPARAQAVADRAAVLIAAGRLDEADSDLSRALDLDPGTAEVVRTLERLTERRGDWRGLRQRLAARIDGVTGTAAAHLWFGIGRANERLGDPAAARTAYERALGADDGFRQAITVLRQLALARGDFSEVARLLEKEIELCRLPIERVGLMIELAVLLSERLDRAARAVEVLDAALAFEPNNPNALDAMFGAALATGSWEKAAQALEVMLGAGIAVADAAQRYHRLGLGAERAGQVDRALGLYSRSYARNPAFRPTLERLSEICFDRQQWDNAWKATEHLIERHGTDLDADARAKLALRSALADLHVAQRLVAAGRVGALLAGPMPQGGLRDVADSWASMRFDPRLLRGLEGDRRARVLSRLKEVLALTENNARHPARSTARETLAALAVVDRRWADALSLLDSFGADATLDEGRRCLFLVTAGDILLHQQGDVAGAAARYQSARALNPREPRLARAGIVSVA
ncbi:MAG: hypothetical protein ABUS79_05385 [Pseudomonadota bacterium]